MYLKRERKHLNFCFIHYCWFSLWGAVGKYYFKMEMLMHKFCNSSVTSIWPGNSRKQKDLITWLLVADTSQEIGQNTKALPIVCRKRNAATKQEKWTMKLNSLKGMLQGIVSTMHPLPLGNECSHTWCCIHTYCTTSHFVSPGDQHHTLQVGNHIVNSNRHTDTHTHALFLSSHWFGELAEKQSLFQLLLFLI